MKTSVDREIPQVNASKQINAQNPMDWFPGAPAPDWLFSSTLIIWIYKTWEWGSACSFLPLLFQICSPWSFPCISHSKWAEKYFPTQFSTSASPCHTNRWWKELHPHLQMHFPSSTDNLLNHISKRLLCQSEHHCLAESAVITGELSSVTLTLPLMGAKTLCSAQ